MLLIEMYRHVTFGRSSVLYQHGVIILNEVVGAEPALDKVKVAVGTFHIANIFIQVGDFEHCMCSRVWNMITVWLDPVRGPLTIDKIELFC